MTNPGLPSNVAQIFVAGTFRNFQGNALAQRLVLSPSLTVTINAGAEEVTLASEFSATPDSMTGFVSIPVVATDDPDLNPTNFTYTVTEPSGRKYPLAVSQDTPVFTRAGHPLTGQRVVWLHDAVPAPGPSSGVVQIVAGPQGPPGASTLAELTDVSTTDAAVGIPSALALEGDGTFSLTPAQPAPDVIVVGATETGVLAAVAAARNGMNVLMISDSERIGGVTGWALTQTDMLTSRSPGMISGLARELGAKVSTQTYTAIFNRWHRVGGNGKPSWWQRAMAELMAGLPIRVVYNSQVESVTKTGTKITSAVIGGRTYTAPMWIDATPTGDLLQKAVTSKSIGREGTTMFGETGAAIGIRTSTSLAIDPYVTPGNAGSGLLFGVDPGSLGTVGAGDGRVQLFGWRQFLTSVAGEKMAWPEPNMGTYDPTKYELIARLWASDTATYNATDALTRTFTVYDLTEGGTMVQGGDPYKYIDLNSRLYLTGYPHAAESLEYVTATAARRAQIRENARQYQLGLIYFILNSTDSRIPANLKAGLAQYGPSNRELQAYAGMSPQFYAREGCRVVGDFVLTKDNAIVTNGYTDWIAWGAYNFDCKDARILNVGGVAHSEGSFQTDATAATAGFPIPYRVLLPKAAECTNLLCPGQPSVSRYVHTAVRAIPILMSLGEAAGYAASLAVRNNQTVQAVDPVRVQQLQDLRKVRGSIVIAIGEAGGTRSESGTGAAFATVTGTDERWGAGYTARSVPAGTDRKAKYQPNIFRAGPYKVFLMYPPAQSTDPLLRATNVPVTISHVDGTVTRTVNQQYPGGSSGFWDYLGEFFLASGVPSASYVEISAVGTNGIVMDAAVKFVPAD